MTIGSGVAVGGCAVATWPLVGDGIGGNGGLAVGDGLAGAGSVAVGGGGSAGVDVAVGVVIVCPSLPQAANVSSASNAAAIISIGGLEMRRRESSRFINLRTPFCCVVYAFGRAADLAAQEIR